jgi:hypothetical protein
MTGLQKAVEHGQASTFEDQKQSQTGFPFKKIVYVGDLSGEPSYGLRYTQQLAHERHAELVLVHSLDPVVYALPGTELRDDAAKAELTDMELDPQRHGANHESLVQREQICAEILREARHHSATLLILSSARLSSRASLRSKPRTCREIPTPLFHSPLELHHRKAAPTNASVRRWPHMWPCRLRRTSGSRRQSGLRHVLVVGELASP